MQTENRWAISLVFVVGLGVIYGIVYGPLAAFWSELFDTRYRYTALSTLYQVSGILASGLTPLIAAWLVTRGDGTLWWVAGYNVLVAAISLVCARFLPETRGSGLDRRAPRARARARGSRSRSERRGRVTTRSLGRPPRHTSSSGTAGVLRRRRTTSQTGRPSTRATHGEGQQRAEDRRDGGEASRPAPSSRPEPGEEAGGLVVGLLLRDLVRRWWRCRR